MSGVHEACLQRWIETRPHRDSLRVRARATPRVALRSLVLTCFACGWPAMCHWLYSGSVSSATSLTKCRSRRSSCVTASM